MTDTSTVGGGRAPSNPTTYNPFAGTSFPPGTPVRQDLMHDDTVLPGRADSIDTTILTGIAVNAGAGVDSRGLRASHVLVQYVGPLTLTVAQWSEVTGNPNGLIRGVPYFLSSTNTGQLTTVAPGEGGSFVAPIGVGLSATTLFILLSFPIANAGLELQGKPGAPAASSSSGKSA